MNRLRRLSTDRELKARLTAGPLDRGLGDGLTLVASATAARAGRASWILRDRLDGKSKAKLLGRHPELSLRDARRQVLLDREQIERRVDVSLVKQTEKALTLQVPTVQRLGDLWKVADSFTNNPEWQNNGTNDLRMMLTRGKFRDLDAAVRHCPPWPARPAARTSTPPPVVFTPPRWP